MIEKTAEGFKVVSEEGKNLSAPDLSHGAAEKRLEQVEFFKHGGVAGEHYHHDGDHKHRDARGPGGS